MLKNFLKRNVGSRGVQSDNDIDNIQYNSMSGAQKNISVGTALEYVGDLTAATRVYEGQQLFILNLGTLQYVTMSTENTVTANAVPGDDTFPVFPGQFTAYSAADYKYIVGSADLHLYILRDDSSVVK